MHINRNTGSFQNCNQFRTTLFPPLPTTEKVAHNINSMLYYISISILVCSWKNQEKKHKTVKHTIFGEKTTTRGGNGNGRNG